MSQAEGIVTVPEKQGGPCFRINADVIDHGWKYGGSGQRNRDDVLWWIWRDQLRPGRIGNIHFCDGVGSCWIHRNVHRSSP